MRSELDEAIRAAMVSVRRRHVVDRIKAVVRHYGSEGGCALPGGRTTDEGSATLTIAGGQTTLEYRTGDGIGPRTRVNVTYGGCTMFSATMAPEGAVFPNADPRRIMRGRGYTLVVSVYRPGVWMRALELKRLIRQEAANQRRVERERLARERQQAKPKPYREPDANLAESFGLPKDLVTTGPPQTLEDFPDF